MFKCVEKLKKKNTYDNNLLDDLTTIIQRIEEERFI
jgi:hypothetical protein